MKWTYLTGGVIRYSSPAIGADGTIYIGNYGDNKVYALNPDGTLKWFYETGNQIRASPSIAPDGTVYIGGYDGNLYAFAGVVNATADTRVGQAPLAVNFQGTSPLTVTAWHWDFGDGTTSTEQNPSHTYASAGTYTVNLTVTHADGTNYLRQTEYIKAYDSPAAGFTANVTEGPYPLAVGFTDRSTGTPTSWNWDFGDGATSTEQNPVHTYTAAGTYTVTLTAANPAGSNTTIRTDSITVSTPVIPQASFTASQTAGAAPLTVRFNDTSLYHPTSWLWDFGDGNTSTEQNPSHTYSYAGTFTVSLNATNSGGSDTVTRTGYISVSDPAAPTASFTASGRVGIAPLTIRFTDTSKDYPTSWFWDFGDGTTSTEQNPTHTYTAVGKYTVNLTAANADGSSSTTQADYIAVIGTELAPLPAGQSINIYVANDEGIKYNVENGVTESKKGYTPYVFIDNTYHFIYGGSGGGTNALHVSNDPSVTDGQVTTTTNQSGEFWLTFTGGQDNLHDAVLLLAVNGTIPDDFSVRIRSSGYDFAPPIPGVGNNETIGDPVYVNGAINQTFTREDFIYGPQIWRPHRVSDYPIFVGQDMSDAENTFELMFIDLRLGCTKTKSDGYVRVEYELNNLTTFAVFNAYGWYSASNHGTGLIMTTSGTEYQVVGASGAPGPAAPVADFTANVTSGKAPLAVQFTDASTGTVTSWAWDFENDSVVDSTEQNPTFTYTAPGTYSVNLTVTNAAGSDAKIKTGYITVTEPLPAAPVADFSADPTSGTSPLAVQFTDASTGSPTGWAWYFGDENFTSSWTQMNSSAEWPARYALASVALPDGSIVLMGGQAAGKLNDVWRSTDNGATWTQMTASAGWSGRCAQTSVALPDGSIVLMGGQDNSGFKNDVWRSTDNGATWTRMTANAGWSARYLSTSVVLPDGSIVLMGGRNSGGNKNDVWRSTDNGATWIQMTAGAEWVARNSHASVALPDGSIVLMGGEYSSGNKNDVWRSTDMGATWTQMTAGAEWVARNSPTSGALPDGSIVLMGGHSGSRANDVWRSTDNGATWTQMANAEWSARWAHASAVLPDGTIVLMGGYDVAKKNDVWQLLTAGSLEQNPSHTYTVPGTYHVTLISRNAGGSDTKTKTDYISVTSGGSGGDAPVANFTATPTSGDTPLTVQFTDASSGIPTSWVWDFENDGVVDSTEQNPSFTYTTAGTYTVNLTVVNAGGSDAAVKTDYITATSSSTTCELPRQNGLNLSVINKQRPGLYDSVHPGTYFFNIGNNMYNGGQNAIHISDSYLTADGTITVSDSSTGTFYITDTGGKGYEDEAILLIAVQENELSEDFSIDLTVEGYKFLDHAANVAPTADEVGTFNSEAYVATLNASDFLTYDGVLVSQAWKPSTGSDGDVNKKFFDGQDLDGPKYNLILVDLNTSIVGRNAAYETTLTNYGNPKVTYTIHGYSGGNVSFAPYAYVSYQTGGGSAFDRTVGWTSRSSTNSWLVTLAEAGAAPIADFTADVTSGKAPLAVQFTDASTGTPAAWAWDFGDNATSDQQHPAHTYTTVGTYTVNLTVTNAAGSNSSVKIDYITVTAPATPDLTVSTLAPNNGEVFSNSDNTYTAKITNIGTGAAGAFAVGFNVSGVTGTVAVPDGLAAGANATVAWTDETVRAAGENVTVTVVADADGAIAEADEENNPRTVEKIVVANGYRGKRWTGGDDLTATKTYDVRGDLLRSAGDSAYLSAATNWTEYRANWTAADLPIPANATIAAARLYVPYTEDKGPVFPANVALTFNGVAVEQAAAYEDEKMWGSTYPYGMTVYDVAGQFSKDGNAAILANAYPGGGNVSVRGMLLAVVYDDGTTAPHTVVMNEGFDLLYGGAAQGTTPEQATAYAPFAAVESGATGARLITVAPGAGPTEGDLLFNGETWTNVWNYTGTSQIGVDERNVTSYLAGENTAAFRSDGDWMEAAAAFLVVEYPLPTGSIAVASTPIGAAVFLDGEDTGLATDCTLPNVPAGDHIVTLKLDGYADASAPVTVLSGETATVTLALTTLTGSLAVTSAPEGARIFIDGADTGQTTNATLDGIAVGTHTVTVTKEGYRDATAEVTIAYNQTAPLHLALVEAVGSIAVTSVPTGAAILLDGTATGDVTNATLTGIPAGEHTVTVTKDGYADATVDVTVEHGKTSPVHFALAVPTGSIAVTSIPDGARIYLDGADTGEVTNTTLINVPAGEHTVRVELEGYLAAEETVIVTAGGTISCHLDLDRIVTMPVADFSADVTSGAAPLTVTFTDISTGDPTAWSWTFGDGKVSSEQNPVHTYVAAGTYAVNLTVTNGHGSNSMVKIDYISVTSPQGDRTQDTPLDIPGCNVTTGNDGKPQVSINTTATNATVAGNTIRIAEGNFTLTIETEGAPTVGNGTVNGTVAGITLDTQPVTTELGAIGTVSASVSANLTGIPQGAGLTTTVSQNVSADAQSAFQLAASADGLALGDVAYTLNIVKTNLANDRDIAGATIRMAVGPAWVAAHGGVDAIRIIRSAEDGTKEVLATTLVGTDASGNMVFEAVSPNGLSIFGLAAATAASQPTQASSSSGGSSGTSTAVGAASNLKAGESATLAMRTTAISAVTVTTNHAVKDVMVTVAPGTLPQGAEPPAGTVYQYVQATLYKATEADLAAVQFRLAISNRWLAGQGRTAEQVTLFRYASGAWQAVPVEALDEESGNAVFSAAANGFGLFAIAATGEIPGTAGEATLQPTAAATPVATAAAQAAGSTPTPQASPLPVWAAILAFGFLLFVRRT